MSTFAAQIAAFGTKAKEKQIQALKKVSFEMFGRVIMRSPVDKGRFRGNWQATIGQPAAGEVDVVDEGPVNAGGSLSGSGEAVANMAVVVLGADNPTHFYLTNTLPYAAKLEYKQHSDQAPAGMVRVTASEFAGVVGEMEL